MLQLPLLRLLKLARI